MIYLFWLENNYTVSTILNIFEKLEYIERDFLTLYINEVKIIF
jgi:hypothetical protein